MGRSREVDAWLAKYDNPMKAVVQRIRTIVLDADARMDECIKWQAPTFTYRGNLASFYPKSRQHASLMFHQGAHIPGTHARLEGSGDTSRVLKIGSVAEADAARPDIERIVRAWCDWRDDEAAGGRTAPARAAKKSAARAAKKTSPANAAKKASSSRAAKKTSPANAAKKASSSRAAKKTSPANAANKASSSRAAKKAPPARAAKTSSGAKKASPSTASKKSAGSTARKKRT
jgi:uncharacterized protein YdhG (YjbR/CyaY superfamily)